MRHQIALVLPFRSTFSIELNRYEQNPDALFLCRELKIKQGHSLLPKMSALVSVKLIPVAKMRFHLFGNPAILKSGPVVLRHQITLVLPFRSTFQVTSFRL